MSHPTDEPGWHSRDEIVEPEPARPDPYERYRLTGIPPAWEAVIDEWDREPAVPRRYAPETPESEVDDKTSNQT